ncbi:MAG: energy transducer TonB [Sphingomonadaceae bacterium]|nr:energy transducer TonB [Sphingomonadaceae bacterium]
MAKAALRTEEWAGLAVAAALHAGLVWVLLQQPAPPPALPEPERMTVNLAEEVGLEATAPDPVLESRAAIAPTLSEEPAPLPPEVITPIEPKPAPEPVVKKVSPPPPKPKPKPDRTERRRPDTPSTAKQSVPTPPKSAPKSGGSRIGSDFLPGAGASTKTEETRIPASQIGQSAKASIVQSIIRQIKPHWNAPEGPDAELLVTILAFDLNPDGSLAGRPRVVRQSGDNPTNLAQKDLHAERAIRAVQLAAPFDLPPEYYNAWKRINGARFDRNLSR